jgi:enamine deaminase RidA (YjgF/YER057c/UK114 family)
LTVPDRAWEPAGSSGLDIPYSPAAVAGGTVWVSGCISTDEAGEIVADDFASQARRVYDGMRRALEAAGCSMDDVVSVTTYLTDRDDFDAFNDAFRAAFRAPFPSRATVLAELIVPGLKIEATCVAVRPA